MWLAVRGWTREGHLTSRHFTFFRCSHAAKKPMAPGIVKLTTIDGYPNTGATRPFHATLLKQNGKSVEKHTSVRTMDFLRQTCANAHGTFISQAGLKSNAKKASNSRKSGHRNNGKVAKVLKHRSTNQTKAKAITTILTKPPPSILLKRIVIGDRKSTPVNDEPHPQLQMTATRKYATTLNQIAVRTIGLAASGCNISATT
mmetsp:Transcript_51793/g.150599  ORF Transcript_51793/g.150599 Transcript_51793/m.150599 type:complete len:201 (+) Transcript_51793:40-642(+)